MDWIRTLLSRCLAQFSRTKRDKELDDELRAHLEMAIEENLRAGMSQEEARTAALRAFGGVTQTREAYRVQRGVKWPEQLAREFRFAGRGLRKAPGFSLTAILTLALGIGAVTSVFSVIDAVVLKPFPFPDRDRLVVLRETIEDASGRAAIPDNYRHVMRLKSTAGTLQDVAIFGEHGASVSPDGSHPQVLGEVMASPNLFSVLGVQPMLGRSFVDGDARQGANPVAVLSYAGWQALFGGEPGAIGSSLRIDGQPVTVVGVLPATMRFPQVRMAPSTKFQESARDVLLFEPLTPSDRDLHRDMGNFNYKAIARLKPGVSLAQANAELESLQNAYTLSARLPLHFGIALTPLQKDVASGISGALWMLFGAVGAVLLIACVNLANLQLARAVNAQRETAVLAALGASRTQLVRSRLAESLLLALAGGAGGAALSFAGVRLLLALAPSGVPRLEEVRVSAPALVFAAGVSMLAAIAFGILPALRSLHVQPQAALHGNPERAGNTREGSRARSIMVAGQVACTVVLLILTSLALRSFARLMNQDRGFDASHVTVAEADLFTPAYDQSGAKGNATRLALADRITGALSQLPGVESVAITSVAPLTGENWVDSLHRPDHPVPDGRQPEVNVRWIDPEYLPTMHTPVVAGRNFTPADQANPYVALISERTAREGFSGEDPLGHKIIKLVPDDQHPLTIVGVVADARINGLKDDAAMVYLPYWAYTPLTLSFLVRSSQPKDALVPEIRRAIWSSDPRVAIPRIKSMDAQVSDSAATDRFQAIVLTSFGTAALLLALLGVYGVLSYSVTLRRREFGIRIALGSGKRALMKIVLSQAAYPVLLGTGVGLAVAMLLLRWIRSVFYESPGMDPMAIGGSLVLLFIAASAAAILPARRAAAVDPMRALRIE
jgi:predicted permease